MKYRIHVAALLLLATSAHANNISGKSFFSDFFDHSLYTNMHGSTLTVDQHNDDGHVLNKPQLQTTVFGSRSRDVSGLREYFLFGGKHSLSVDESIVASAEDNAPDIIAGDFNIRTANGAQSSKITFSPQQRIAGLALSFRYPFKEKYWVSVEAPFMRVKNALSLTETFTYTPHTTRAASGGFDANNNTSPVNMLQAFRQPRMLYGRIEPTVNKKIGLADLTIRAGRNLINRKNFFLSAHAGLTIPTGNRPDAKRMWQAIVGNNHHVGVLTGATAHLVLHERNNNKVWVTTNVNTNYLFENTQKRSFDLKNGPWTRYLAMYASGGKRSSDEKTFGINLMTKDVTVRPGAQGNITTIFSLMSNKWNLNLGTSTRFREAEKVALKEAWAQGPIVATANPDVAASLANRHRRMGRNFAGNNSAADLFITEDELDLNSAAHPSVVAHTLFASTGYYHQTNHPQHYEAGASYDFARQNSAISRWSVWGKIQITF